ncbi:MAG: tRNA (adenosine(37)-N6)-threonylcarbamoyltransferase complex ATPase subunit type 1 TsaE [Clostridiales bacterium]|nr:tRNA (adenosine(37)-N6)-threonylcarbamoyltransferase complex ATPase subunit type 1 TsaE [Clostridiales bacterium]
MKLYANNVGETEKIATAFAKTLKPGDCISLEGDLGAGKTAFTKALANAIGIQAEVVSPTYAYMNDYEGKLYHFDFYRLSSGEDAEALGLTDYFYANAICVFEWACNVWDVIPENTQRIIIEKTGETSRAFTFEKELNL